MGEAGDRADGRAGSVTACLGPGKRWGWCSCSAKRDSKNRRYLGHGVAESIEDRLLESSPSDSRAIKRSVKTMSFGLSCFATWGKPLNLSGL